MASLPADRTKLALAQSNQVPNMVIASAKNINAIVEVYDTVDLLNQKVDLNYGTGAIGTNQLATDSVTLVKMANASVGTTELVDSSVTLAKMADASVGTIELIDLSVTTAKIALASVGVAQLSPGATVNESVNNALITALTADTTQRAINVMYPPVPMVGAKGDGTTDDAAAIQAIVNYAQTNGLNVFIPKGVFIVNVPITLSTSPIKIFGLNYANSSIQAGTAMQSVFLFSDSAQNERFTFEDIGIHGGGFADHGISSAKLDLSMINRVRVRFTNVSAIKTGHGYVNEINSCDISQNYGHGIELTSNANNILNVKNSIINSNGGIGILLQNGYSVNIEGCTIESNQQCGIYALGGISSLNILNNYFESNSVNGVSFTTPVLNIKADIIINSSTVTTTMGYSNLTKQVRIEGNSHQAYNVSCLYYLITADVVTVKNNSFVYGASTVTLLATPESTVYSNISNLEVYGNDRDNDKLVYANSTASFNVPTLASDGHIDITISGNTPVNSIISVQDSAIKIANKNIFNSATIISGQQLTVTGTTTANATRFVSDYIALPTGKNFTVYNPTLVCYYDSSKVFTRQFTYGGAGQQLVNLNAGEVYIRFDSTLAALGSSQLEAGVMLTFYTPHFEQYIYPKWNGIGGKSLPTISDTIDLTNGLLTQNVSDPYTLDGAISWSLDATLTTVYRFKWFNHTLTNFNTAQASTNNKKLNVNGSDWTYLANFTSDTEHYYIDTSIYFFVNQATINAQAGATTLDKFKAYLNATPGKLLYQLSVPAILNKIPYMIQAGANDVISFIPRTKFVLKPSAGVITIPNTTLPITTIISVYQCVNGVPSQLAAVTSNTTTTITLTSPVNTSEYQVIYEYALNLTSTPSFSVNYNTTNRGQIESVMDKMRKISKQLNDFVAYQNSINLGV